MDEFDAWWRDRYGSPITWMDDDARGNAAQAWSHQQRIIDDLRTALAAATERAEDLKTAWRVANARADALAARLAEVEDREHSA